MKERKTEFEGLIEYILFNYRWIFVCFFLLPCSFIYDIYTALRDWISFNINKKSATINHDEKVKFIQKQVREWIDDGKKRQMCTARPGWKSITLAEPQYKSVHHNIDIGDMNEILKVDLEKKTVLVEPSVNMGQITRLLLPLGWIIPCVPELEELTVGGLVNGQGVETTSHVYGMFQHTCVSYEIIIADGTVIKCSKDENSDLFYSIPWSYGTIGFLTAIEIQIIPAKKYVQLKYEPVYGLDRVVALLKKEMTNTKDNLFVEGIVFSKNEAVIMSGKMVDEPKNVNSIGRWYKPWFYKHVHTFLNCKKTGVECIPLRDYFHRHTRSFFWEIEDIIPFGNHWLFRWCLGWMTPPKISFLKLTQTEVIKKLYTRTHTIQDLLPPLTSLASTILQFEELYNIYPLWLCPFKLPNSPGFVHALNSEEEELFVDVGIYGVIKDRPYDPYETNRACINFIKANKGYEMLYGGTFLSKDEFYQMFDHSLYEKVRKQYNCENAFPEVYDKVNKRARV